MKHFPHFRRRHLRRGGRALGRHAVAARRGPAEIHHHRHRRRHRRLLRCGRRDLPPRQQGPRQARHPLFGRVDRRVGVQRQHDQGRRTRHGLRPVGRAVQRHQGHGPVQGRRRLGRPARRVLGAPGAVHRGRAQGSRRQDVHRLQGQALQRRQSGLGHARVDGRAADRHELEDGRFLARLRAQGRRARPGAVRRQDRRLLLRGRPSVGEHPGPDDVLRREAGLADRPRRRQAGRRASRTTPRRRSLPACTRTIPRPRRPTACWRRWSRRRRCPPTPSTRS